MYGEGRGVARDDVQAVVWLRKSAEAGDANGELGLARMLGTGRGVAKNDAEAMVWLRKSVAQGNAQAKRLLGHLKGTGQVPAGQASAPAGR